MLRFLGPRVKLANCKSALNPSEVYSTDRSMAMVPMLVLLFVALWFILRGDLFLSLVLCYFVLVFSVLLALRTFVRFALLWFCLPLGVWEGLWLVIVALPGLFSYLFYFKSHMNRDRGMGQYLRRK